MDEDLSRYFAEIEMRVDSHYADRVVSPGTIVEIGTSDTCGELLNPPILAARATGTTVTPLDRQRLTPSALRRAS
jgi:hypothetical protein